MREVPLNDTFLALSSCVVLCTSVDLNVSPFAQRDAGSSPTVKRMFLFHKNSRMTIQEILLKAGRRK